MPYKLGSLFDGSGGFPLSGSLCGIEPRWAAEVEPYPIAVTRTRFPNMRHLGDISKVNGADIEPVDIITFGSPCQDLSVAGKRAGLKHEANGDDETTRSGLFMEAVRIIKEMREATNGLYPRFALWENVPGAFSSNKGEDFRIVCEELIKVVEPSASMPSVPQKGWTYADSYIGDGWSLAYRVFDAQYWGVPQRRRRIHLVVDFRGTSAREVLFEREGVRGYFTEGRTPWQTAPSDAQDCAGADDREGEGADGTGGERGRLDAVAYTLKIRSGVEVDANGKGAGKGPLVQVDKSATLSTVQDQYLFAPVIDANILDDQGGQQVNARTDGKCPTLRAEMHGNIPSVLEPVAYSFDSLASNSMKSKNPHSGCRAVEVAKTLDTTDPSPNKNQGGIAIVAPVAYSIENHPADSRVNIDESGTVQTLTSRMGTGGGNVPMVMEPVAFDGANVTSPVNASNPQPGDPCHTLSTDSRNYLVAPVIDVEMEVATRKYEVDQEKLVQLLRNHKGGLSNREIAEKLGKPVTMVEHWFRTDKGFAVPDPDVWFALKKLLTIETDEFDKCVTEFEFKGGSYDMRNRIHAGTVSPTLTCGSGNDLHLLPEKPVYCLQGNGIDRADTAGCNGKGWKEDQSYTLNTIDRPAVVYSASKNSHFTRGVLNVASTLVASDYKDPQLIGYAEKEVRYIVRRLTPTECARLQGFADRWGDIEKKDSFTPEEYEFWLNVRNTHAAINGKKVQDYTEAQMATWYNKLQSDANEYKMWGNGIALPPALYCMQGIVDAMNKADEDEWLL